MPVTYEQAPDDVLDLVAAVRKEHHAELDRARVTVCVLMATQSDPTKRPVMFRGRPAYAVVRINPVKDRATGADDARIEIDGPAWEKLTEHRRRALIDHELEHLEIVREKETGTPKYDTAGRPRLKMRLHDVEIGIFTDIVRRHGQDCIDAEHIRAMATRHGQLLMPWAAEVAQRNVEAALGRKSIGEEVADRINAGELGDGVTATLTKGRPGITLPAKTAGETLNDIASRRPATDSEIADAVEGALLQAGVKYERNVRV